MIALFFFLKPGSMNTNIFFWVVNFHISETIFFVSKKKDIVQRKEHWHACCLVGGTLNYPVILLLTVYDQSIIPDLPDRTLNTGFQNVKFSGRIECPEI